MHCHLTVTSLGKNKHIPRVAWEMHGKGKGGGVTRAKQCMPFLFSIQSAGGSISGKTMCRHGQVYEDVIEGGRNLWQTGQGMAHQDSECLKSSSKCPRALGHVIPAFMGSRPFLMFGGEALPSWPHLDGIVDNLKNQFPYQLVT